MIDLSINEENLTRAVQRARERRILIPTFKQHKDPASIPGPIQADLKRIGLWDVHPYNLFRITWKNEPVDFGGGFGGPNFMEVPPEISGVHAKIVALIGKWFPTGAHKVGATFGCLVPRLVTGHFDPTCQKAVWPSTGNFCRGGAYNAALLGCESIAILPEEMSRERFEWLSKIAGEVIATPGCESNVKEIFDKCRELRQARSDLCIFDQFQEDGNYLWHYEVTGHAVEEVMRRIMGPQDRYVGFISQTGSAGTLGAAEYLKQVFPQSKAAAGEALQCPTLLRCGYGGHRIEGIGDKHVPWIHDVRNTDLVIAVDDNACMNILRLFNEPAGWDYLSQQGVCDETIVQLPLLGISSIGNLLCAVKFSRYYELTARDVVVTVWTDSTALYQTRLQEMTDRHGPYTTMHAARDYHRYLMGESTANMRELTHYDRRQIHNLKYFTWIEQQGKSLEELNAQWYDYPGYWERIQQQAGEIDRLIEAFNEGTGLLSAIV